jgi:polyisoprenyl-phosphate glycosyltransferase
MIPKTQLVSIVVPVLNEERNVPVVYAALNRLMESLPYLWEVVFVDDGSTDHTLREIKNLAAENSNVFYISLTRNFGHQAALRAGIGAAKGDCIISMDGDMQHPPAMIPVMLGKWEEGFDIVYTIRKDHESTGFKKKLFSRLFYKVLNALADMELNEGEADFRLISRRVAEVLNKLEEPEIFYRGMVKWLGFNQTGIEYQAAERRHGHSKYNWKKMMSLAMHGITSFSIKPLRAAAYLGIIIAMLSVLYLPYTLISRSLGHAVSGWSSLIVTIAFFGGLQLFVMGVIGIYLGKLFMHSKNRPSFIVKEMEVHEPLRVIEF